MQSELKVQCAPPALTSHETVNKLEDPMGFELKVQCAATAHFYGLKSLRLRLWPESVLGHARCNLCRREMKRVSFLRESKIGSTFNQVRKLRSS